MLVAGSTSPLQGELTDKGLLLGVIAKVGSPPRDGDFDANGDRSDLWGEGILGCGRGCRYHCRG